MQGASQKRVSFITLGCAKNEVDSAHMAARLAQAGYEVVDQELLEEAEDGIGSATEALDAIIVNTCSFLREAIEENLDVIFDVAFLLWRAVVRNWSFPAAFLRVLAKSSSRN